MSAALRMSVALVALGAATLVADAADAAKPFRQGSFRPSLSAGGNSSGFGIGAGAAYCLVDGLEAEASVFHWFGDPSYTQFSPGVRYVVLQLPAVHPYIGAFYRRQVVHDDLYDDADFVGGRLGAFFSIGERAYVGIGAGYEQRLDCDDDADLDGDGKGGDCSGFFPELMVTVAL